MGTYGSKSQTTCIVILKFINTITTFIVILKLIKTIKVFLVTPKFKKHYPSPGMDKCRCLFGWYLHSDILSKSY